MTKRLRQDFEGLFDIYATDDQKRYAQELQGDPDRRSIFVRRTVLSELEKLAEISGGTLLAKILFKLTEEELKVACRLSKTINNVCERFKLKERFYRGKIFMFLSHGWKEAFEHADPIRLTLPLPTVVNVEMDLDDIIYVLDNNGRFLQLEAEGQNVIVPGKIIEPIPDKTFQRIVVGHVIVYLLGKDNRLYGYMASNKGHQVILKPKFFKNQTVLELKSTRYTVAILYDNGKAKTIPISHEGSSERHRVRSMRAAGWDSEVFENRLSDVPYVSSSAHFVTCAVGLFATFFVTREGRVFLVGVNDPFHPVLRTIFNPMEIQFPQEQSHHTIIVRVIAYYASVFFLSSTGRCWVLGQNNNGELAINRREHIISPVMIETIFEPIQDIAGGPNFTVFLGVSGTIYYTGRGSALARVLNFNPTIPIEKIMAGGNSIAIYTQSEDETFLSISLQCASCGITDETVAYYSNVGKLAFCNEQCFENFKRKR